MIDFHIFRHNETVQVLDETTYIWEAAKILGLPSDWSAKVKWIDWSSKPPVVIEVRESLRTLGVEFWPVRKWQTRPIVTEDLRRKRPTNVQHQGNYQHFTGNPAKLPRNQKVCYFLY